MQLLFRLLKWIGIAFMSIVVFIFAFFIWLSGQPFVPKNYTKKVETAGELEKK